MAIKRAIRQKMVLTGNDSLDSFVGLENMLLNLKHVFNNPGVNALFGRFIKNKNTGDELPIIEKRWIAHKKRGFEF